MRTLPRPVARLLFWPTLAWNWFVSRALGRRHWWDRVDDHVVLGALPFASDVPRLAAEGVRAAVNTCEEYAGPAAEYARAGINQLRIPTTDFNPPRLEDLERAVAYIRERAERGESVYVHCKAGRGRSVTVVLCWLVESQRLTPDEALEYVRARRPHVGPSPEQMGRVREFAERRRLS